MAEREIDRIVARRQTETAAPGSYHYLWGLDALQALRLLAAFIESDAYHELLLDDLQIFADISHVGAEVTLRFADPYANDLDEPRIAAYTYLREQYERMMDTEPRVGPDDGDPYATPAATLPKILANASVQPYYPEEHGFVKRETLLVAPNLKTERARDIFNTIRNHSTHVRFSVHRAQGMRYYLFHVLDDSGRVAQGGRLSTFQSALQAGSFDDCDQLATFSVSVNPAEPDYRLFLPPSWKPERSALQHFCRIMLDAPQVFDVGNNPALTDLLGAVYMPNKSEQTGKVFRMVHLPFLYEWQVARIGSYATFQTLDLIADDEHIESLQKNLMTEEAQAGFRLRLIAATYTEHIPQEYQRIRMQMNALDDRRVEIESLWQPQPLLLRFGQNQLEALMDVLRRYRPQDIAKMLYAFDETESRFTSGVHFLHIDGHIREHGMDPLLWRDINTLEPIRFWLDPSWARIYNKSNTQIQLFVPYGRMLRPMMHSWKPEDMDTYLREMIQIPQEKAYDNPLYLFDQDPLNEQRLLISVLNFNNFKKLDRPQVIGWMNDNLVALRKLPRDEDGFQQYMQALEQLPEWQALDDSVQDFLRGRLAPQERNDIKQLLTDLASAQHREARLNAASNLAATAQERYSQTAQETQEHLQQVTDDLLAQVEAEYSAVVAHTHTFIHQAQALNNRLQTLDALYRVLYGEVEQADALMTASREQVAALYAEMQQLQDQIDEALAAAESRQATLTERVTASVTEMRATRARLSEQIRSLTEQLNDLRS